VKGKRVKDVCRGRVHKKSKASYRRILENNICALMASATRSVCDAMPHVRLIDNNARTQVQPSYNYPSIIITTFSDLNLTERILHNGRSLSCPKYRRLTPPLSVSSQLEPRSRMIMVSWITIYIAGKFKFK
jgi:hypothetical protein